MNWYEDLSGFLLTHGYESQLSGAKGLEIFGPKPLSQEVLDRVRWTKPSSVECVVNVGLLKSTILALAQVVGPDLMFEVTPTRRAVTLKFSPRLIDAIKAWSEMKNDEEAEADLVERIDQIMQRDKYPRSYSIEGRKTWDRYPSLSSDFADHKGHNLDVTDFRIALETAKTVEDLLR